MGIQQGVTSGVTLSNGQPNPFSGSFGSGKIMVFTASNAAWSIPSDKLRVRCFGGGGQGGSTEGSSGGGGGGFTLKTISGLTIGSTVAITAGAGTNSFGAYCSATAGGTGLAGLGAPSVGVGSGGDINTSGFTTVTVKGGHSANIMGELVGYPDGNTPTSLDFLGMGSTVNGAGGVYGGGSLPGGGGCGAATPYIAAVGGKGCVIVEW